MCVSRFIKLPWNALSPYYIIMCSASRYTMFYPIKSRATKFSERKYLNINTYLDFFYKYLEKNPFFIKNSSEICFLRMFVCILTTQYPC
jgi:hypothetical protein